MSTCQTCEDLRSSWSYLDNGEAPPRCPEHQVTVHQAAVQQAAISPDPTRREAAAFRAMAKYGITVGSLDGKRYRASSRLMAGATPEEHPSALEAVEAMAVICERGVSPWPTAEGLEMAANNSEADATKREEAEVSRG
jgi:hypothetical protein